MTRGARTFFSVALVALCLALARPAAAQLVIQAPVAEAESLVGEVARENFYGASREFTDTAAKVYTPEYLEKVWTDLLKRYGSLQSYEGKATDAEGTRFRVHVVCRFEQGYVDALVTFETLGERGPVTLEFLPVAGPTGPFTTR